jgi:hypothetical protein
VARKGRGGSTPLSRTSKPLLATDAPSMRSAASRPTRLFLNELAYFFDFFALHFWTDVELLLEPSE